MPITNNCMASEIKLMEWLVYVLHELCRQQMQKQHIVCYAWTQPCNQEDTKWKWLNLVVVWSCFQRCLWQNWSWKSARLGLDGTVHYTRYTLVIYCGYASRKTESELNYGYLLWYECCVPPRCICWSLQLVDTGMKRGGLGRWWGFKVEVLVTKRLLMFFIQFLLFVQIVIQLYHSPLPFRPSNLSYYIPLLSCSLQCLFKYLRTICSIFIIFLACIYFRYYCLILDKQVSIFFLEKTISILLCIS